MKSKMNEFFSVFNLYAIAILTVLAFSSPVFADSNVVKAEFLNKNSSSDQLPKITVSILPAETSFENFTILFKGGGSTDSVVFSKKRNVLLTEDRKRFDIDKTLVVLAFPENINDISEANKAFYLSGIMVLNKKEYPFSLVWNTTAADIRFIMGKDIFNDY